MITSGVEGGRKAGEPRKRRRSEEHTSELQSRLHIVCRLLLEKKENFARDEHSRAATLGATRLPFWSSSRPWAQPQPAWPAVSLTGVAGTSGQRRTIRHSFWA